ncbi:MAG TPA: serine hydrolase domain-containing protein [Opitutaceae bacterium]|nr:serine hydrolase domain-containing protein [Opitutaceae bacterium]
MQAFVDQGEIAGAVTLVATKNQILHLSAVGKSDLASGRAMKTDDLFWIASMTKPMTAVAVAMLADEGKLSFADPVAKYLPEYGDLWVLDSQTPERRVLVRPARPVTIHDLLTHTSGLGEYVAYGPHWTLAEMVKSMTREPLKFQPGTRWAYSTAGLDALGRIVEVVSGMPYAEFMQKRLFDPLGMKDTTFWPAPRDKARLATSYGRNPTTGRLEPATIYYLYGGAVTDRERPALGGAGLFSTAADVAKFYQMLLNGGMANGHSLLKLATVAELTREQTAGLKAGFLPGSAWGLGFCIVTEPQDATAALSPGTFGHGGAYGTQSWADPRRGAIYVMMIQRAGLPNSDGSEMRQVFQDTAAAALAP